MARSQNSTERALVVCSLWLHGGFIGASALGVTLLELSDGESRGLWALWLAFFGGALAAACWRRGLTVLDRADRASVIATEAPTEPATRPLPKQVPRGALTVVAGGDDVIDVVIR